MIAQRREKNWLDFVDWCRARRLKALPAHPWTVAAYARWCDTHYRRPNVCKRIEAIARAHIFYCAASPDRHPTVMSTLRIIERNHQSQANRSALFRSEDFAGPGAAQPAPPKTKTRNGKGSNGARRLLRSSPTLVARRPAEG
jgi:hypothetical protein